MDPAERLTGEQALRHAYFDDIREPEVEEELTSLIAPVQRPIYSSQSRITSYGTKFGTTYMPGQLIQPGIGMNNQRQNGSVSSLLSEFEFSVPVFLPLTNCSDLQGTHTSAKQTPRTPVDLKRHSPLQRSQQRPESVQQPVPVQDAHDGHGAVQSAQQA